MFKQSNTYFNNLASADLHFDQGKHDEHATGFVDNQLSATVWPDMAASIDERNGWIEPGEEAERAGQQQFESAGDCLMAVLVYLSGGDTLAGIGARAVCLIAAIAPDALGGLSISELARKFGCTKQWISKHSAELHKLAPSFQRGTCFRGTAERERHRDIAIQVHQRLGHKTRIKELTGNFKTRRKPTSGELGHRKETSEG